MLLARLACVLRRAAGPSSAMDNTTWYSLAALTARSSARRRFHLPAGMAADMRLRGRLAGMAPFSCAAAWRPRRALPPTSWARGCIRDAPAGRRFLLATSPIFLFQLVQPHERCRPWRGDPRVLLALSPEPCAPVAAGAARVLRCRASETAPSLRACRTVTAASPRRDASDVRAVLVPRWRLALLQGGSTQSPPSGHGPSATSLQSRTSGRTSACTRHTSFAAKRRHSV